jgi:hypothetical protein
MVKISTFNNINLLTEMVCEFEGVETLDQFTYLFC